MKKQSGFSLLETLIALAIVVVLTAAIGQNLLSVVQATNEKNAEIAVQALVTAEASYNSQWNAYAVGSNLHYLSDCPSPVGGKVTPTSTKACLGISPAYTSGSPVFQYSLGAASVTNDDGNTGFLLTATPTNQNAGRKIFCADNRDGVLRGDVATKVPLTQAQCEQMTVLDPSTTSTTTTAATPTMSGTLLGLNPAGTYAPAVGAYNASSVSVWSGCPTMQTKGCYYVVQNPSAIHSFSVSYVPSDSLQGSGTVALYSWTAANCTDTPVQIASVSLSAATTSGTAKFNSVTPTCLSIYTQGIGGPDTGSLAWTIN